MLNKQNVSRINFLLDVLSFGGICLIAFNKDQKTDPGDFIFLFVFENMILLLSFILFLAIFSTCNKLVIRYRQGVLAKSVRGSLFRFQFGATMKLLASFIFYAFLVFIAIVFINQLTIELLVAYLKDNSYHFKSIQILSEGGVFLEGNVISNLENLFGKSYNLFFWIIGIRYFIGFILDFYSNPIEKRSEIITFENLAGISIKIILGPICIFLASILLVILASIYGAQSWIILLTLAVFRMLFLFIYSKLNKLIKSA